MRDILRASISLLLCSVFFPSLWVFLCVLYCLHTVVSCCLFHKKKVASAQLFVCLFVCLCFINVCVLFVLSCLFVCFFVYLSFILSVFWRRSELGTSLTSSEMGRVTKRQRSSWRRFRRSASTRTSPKTPRSKSSFTASVDRWRRWVEVFFKSKRKREREAKGSN